MARPTQFQKLSLQLDAENRKLKAKLANTKKSMGGISSAAKKMGSMIAGAFAAHKLIGFGREIINLTSEFGSMMSRVKALSSANAEMTNTLREQAKMLGKTTQFTATQAAEAMTFLAQAGLEVDSIYAAMPGTLELAAAGQVSLAEAADIATNVMSAYGLAAEDLGRVNDIIANTTTNANTNVLEFAEAFKMVGPIAKGAKIPIEVISASIGKLANAGIKGTMAGTQLRAMISKLINPTGKAAEVLDKLGIKTLNLDGTMRPLNDIMLDMGKKGTSLSEVFKVFDNRAAAAALVLEKASGTFDEFVDVIGTSGTAARIASEQMDNLKGDTLKLTSAWQGMLLEIGQNSEGIFRTAAQFLTDMTNALGQMFGGENARVNKEISDMVDSFNLLSKADAADEVRSMEVKVTSLNTQIDKLNSSFESLAKKKGGMNEFIQAKQKVEDLGRELKIVEGILKQVSPTKVIPDPGGGGGGGLSLINDQLASASSLAASILAVQLKQIIEEANALDDSFGQLAESTGSIFPEDFADTFFPVIDEVGLKVAEQTISISEKVQQMQQIAAIATNTFEELGTALVNTMFAGKSAAMSFGETMKQWATNLIKQLAAVLIKAVAVAGVLSALGLSSLSFGSIIKNVIAGTKSMAELTDVKSFARGTKFIPSDGLVMAHRGEQILNKGEVTRGGNTVLAGDWVIRGSDLHFVQDRFNIERANSL